MAGRWCGSKTRIGLFDDDDDGHPAVEWNEERALALLVKFSAQDGLGWDMTETM